MKQASGDFSIRVSASGWDAPRELVCGSRGHFVLDDDALLADFNMQLPSAERDLLRVGMAIYVADRLVRRAPASTWMTPVRQIELEVEVVHPEFWNAQVSVLHRVLAVLCDDEWSVRFVGQAGVARQLSLFPVRAHRVFLYSGGLDSAAGLAVRAAQLQEPVVLASAFHQAMQHRRIPRHAKAISEKFGRDIGVASVRSTFGPLMKLRLDAQERSQRCRAILFTCIGGAVASAMGSDVVEVLENGVGIVNLPFMTGMTYGSRATRGCHPQFLRLMSKLVSRVSGRKIDFHLPFAGRTKSELVREMCEVGMGELISDTVSCVHYPRHVPGTAKQCGVCPACIGTQQALVAAGLPVNQSLYETKLFGDVAAANSVDRGELKFLAAILMQVIGLSELCDSGTKPDILRRHFAATDFLGFNESPVCWVNLLRRYRLEWLEVMEAAWKRGVRWDGLLPDMSLAA